MVLISFQNAHIFVEWNQVYSSHCMELPRRSLTRKHAGRFSGLSYDFMDNNFLHVVMLLMLVLLAVAAGTPLRQYMVPIRRN